jgi:hypothetical protein
MRSPVNASPRPSRATAHDSGSMWLRYSFIVRDLHPLLFAGLPANAEPDLTLVSSEPSVQKPLVTCCESDTLVMRRGNGETTTVKPRPSTTYRPMSTPSPPSTMRRFRLSLVLGLAALVLVAGVAFRSSGTGSEESKQVYISSRN